VPGGGPLASTAPADPANIDHEVAVSELDTTGVDPVSTADAPASPRSDDAPAPDAPAPEAVEDPVDASADAPSAVASPEQPAEVVSVEPDPAAEESVDDTAVPEVQVEGSDADATTAPATVDVPEPPVVAAAPAADDARQRRIACLLSVRRSVSWAGRQPGGAPHLRHIGAASVRLLAPYVPAEGEDAELTELFDLLAAADAAPEGNRKRALAKVRRAADAMLGDAAPRRRKRKPRRPKPAAAPVAEAPSEAVDGGAAATPRAEPQEDAPAEAPPEDANRKRRRGRRRGKEKRREAEAAPPAAKSPPPPKPEATPAIPQRPLGHPDGTGRTLAELEVFDEDELEALKDAGLVSWADLLLRGPVRQVRSNRVSINDVPVDEPVTVRGKVLWRLVRVSPHARRWEVALGDGSGPVVLARWFRRAPRGFSAWTVGSEIGLHGEVRDADSGPTLYEAEPLGPSGRGSGLLPVYEIDGVDDARIRDAIAAALDREAGLLEDWLPTALLEQHRLLGLEDALRDAHFPANATCRGRVRLAFDEMFSIQVGVAWRSGRGKQDRGISHKPSHTGIGQIEAQHQVRLDDAQEAVFSEIRRDLVRPAPMTRLLQGDVGAGKGLVAQLAAVWVAGGGNQVAMISPDALAAERRYLHIDPILRSIGVKTLLITDQQPDRGQLDAIRRGEAQIVFGTAGLLDKSVAWKRLGLVTIDERGPYGVVPAGVLQRRGARPDLLVIPRAPIPSSLAFTVFGEFDVSMLASDAHPPVQCTVHPTTERNEAYAPLREAIAEGRQGYVVFPVRDGRDLLSVEDAIRTAKALQSEALPGARMGVISSEMSRDERGRVFDDFLQRRIDVLVCTTHIEDSPPVANATAVVVEYADLHDLVRLHRLRAHVSGGYRAGTCSFVLSDSPDPVQVGRLDQLIAERDGFRLAELDLQFRGAAALLGDRATEAPDFIWADPPEDRGLLMRARNAAFDFVRRDPELRRTPGVAAAVNSRWGDWLGQALPRGPARKKRSDSRRRRRRRR